MEEGEPTSLRHTVWHLREGRMERHGWSRAHWEEAKALLQGLLRGLMFQHILLTSRISISMQNAVYVPKLILVLTGTLGSDWHCNQHIGLQLVIKASCAETSSASLRGSPDTSNAA